MIKLFEDAYTVAVMKEQNLDIKNIKGTFHVLKNGLTFWTADPFPIEIHGELYIFAEMWRYRYLKGCIGYSKLTENGFTKWKPVIEEPFHLSYPNIFVENGKIYMCPESNEAEEIFLYECMEFPEQWKKVKVLNSGEKYCDSTFYNSGKDTFGFTYQLTVNSENILKFFKIENEEIQMSKGNILTLGNEMIRPGGKILKSKNAERDLRVIQLGIPSYGSGLIFTEFYIDWPNFEEKEVLILYPNDLKYDKNKRYTGMHTFNRTESYIVIDLKWNRINLLELFFKTIRRFKKMGNGLRREKS